MTRYRQRPSSVEHQGPTQHVGKDKLAGESSRQELGSPNRESRNQEDELVDLIDAIRRFSSRRVRVGSVGWLLVLVFLQGLIALLGGLPSGLEDAGRGVAVYQCTQDSGAMR
jgi:hypothetical protein